MQFNKRDAFSLLELMVVMTIVAVLAMGAQTAYSDYTKRTTIAALTQLAGGVKIDVENSHNQGVIFGTSGNQSYIDEVDPDKPLGLNSLIRVSYGCIDIDVALADLNLTASENLTMTLCPKPDASNYIVWQCGYQPTSYASYIKYLPPACQNAVATIQDTAF